LSKPLLEDPYEDDIIEQVQQRKKNDEQPDAVSSLSLKFRNLFFGLRNPKQQEEINKYDKFRRIPFSRFVASALVNNPGDALLSTLDMDQLEQCANIWANDGIIRRGLNKLDYAIHPTRIQNSIELNEEFTGSLTQEKLEILQRQVFGEGDSKVIRLKQKLIRVNKRCKLQDRTSKLTKKTWIYGRGGLETKRFPRDDNEWPLYGEPRALIPMYSTRIQKPILNSVTRELTGFTYDDPDTRDGDVRNVKIPNLIPAFNDDDGIFEFTEYSGISMLWPILSVSQTNEVMNDEDLPAAIRQLWTKFGHIYTGDNKESTTKEIKKEWQAGSLLIHHKPGLKMEIADMTTDIMQLINAREGNAKYLLWSIGIPMFIMFEDAANYATADKALQAFKAGVVDFYRTWLRGILEDYYFDPILADHLNVPLDQVISERLKIKAIFEEIVYDTRKDIILAEKDLFGMRVHDGEDVLEKLGEDKILEKWRARARAQADARQQDIDEMNEQARRNEMGEMDMTDAINNMERENNDDDNNQDE
jgi:hypothetical protein